MTTTTTTTNRRTAKTVLLLVTVTLLAGALVLLATTGTATAEISTEGLTVQNGTYSADDGDVHSPVIATSGSFEFLTENTPGEFVVALLLSTNGQDYQPVDTQRGEPVSNHVALPYTVSGPLVAHDDFSPSDFEVPAGESVSHEVYVRITLAVIGQDGQVITTTKADDVATVTVTNTGTKVTASITGTGDWLWWEDGTDPEPTPTP